MKAIYWSGSQELTPANGIYDIDCDARLLEDVAPLRGFVVLDKARWR